MDSKVGMVTCSKEHFLGSSSLTFIVIARIVLVLDRKNLDTGQVIGILCEDDVACPSLVEQNWLMLPEGSWVRHPKLRTGRIRLRRDGWLVITHQQYGHLFTAFPYGRARTLFLEDGFVNLPNANPPESERKRRPKKSSEPTSVQPAPKDQGLIQHDVEENAANQPQESLEDHMKACKSQHWEVTHTSVNVRANFQRRAECLRTLDQGSVICLGCIDGIIPSSPDGTWVRCMADAKLWTSAASFHPVPLLGSEPKSAEGYVLKANEDHAMLRNIDSQPPEPKSRPSRSAKEDRGKDRYLELRTWMLSTDYWIVENSEVHVHTQRSEASPVEFSLQERDLLFTHREGAPTVWQEATGRWLVVPVGAQVFRKQEPLFPHQGAERIGYALLEDAGKVQISRSEEPAVSATIRFIAAYGEPWTVEQEQVAVYPERSAASTPLGILIKGDVVGIKRRLGDWLQLTCDSEVRSPVAGIAKGDPRLISVSPAMETTEMSCWSDAPREQGARRGQSSKESVVRRLAWSGTCQEAWVPARDASLGPVLRRCEEPGNGGLSDSCMLGGERRQLYRQVLGLCHQRIYAENLNGLWDGDRARLPTLESLEAKLLHPNATVVHVTHGQRLAGGAVILALAVKARCVPSEAAGEPATASVCYIDMCAAKPGTHAGSDVWDSLRTMNFACIACHPILLQETVNFWQSRGMRRFDVSNAKDCDDFRKQVHARTGNLMCELADLQEAIPSSKLPLLVFISEQFTPPRIRFKALPDH